MKTVSRWIGAICVAVACGITAPSPSLAAPINQAPGYYRYAVGDFVVTALLDGVLNIQTKNFQGLPPEEMDALVARAFSPIAPRVPIAVNAYLVDTGTHTILVDTGTVKCFGDNPSLDKFPGNLRESGYAPEDIDVIVLTHMHGDHICALATPDGKRRFPNAMVWAAKEEAAYWLSEEIASSQPEPLRTAFKQVRDTLAIYGKAFHTFEPDTAIVPGMRIVSARGHTPGHTAFLFESKGASLLAWGDIVICPPVQFPHPEVSTGSDVDAQLAVATRRAMFERVAKNRTTVAGSHLPFPGLGHIRKDGDGYVWIPVEFGPLPN